MRFRSSSDTGTSIPLIYLQLTSEDVIREVAKIQF